MVDGGLLIGRLCRGADEEGWQCTGALAFLLNIRIELKKAIFKFERKSCNKWKCLCRAHLIGTTLNLDQRALSWWRTMPPTLPCSSEARGSWMKGQKLNQAIYYAWRNDRVANILQPTPPWKIAQACGNAAPAKRLSTRRRCDPAAKRRRRRGGEAPRQICLLSSCGERPSQEERMHSIWFNWSRHEWAMCCSGCFCGGMTMLGGLM